MTYKAYLKQIGEGCDYSIGCAQTVISIEAKDIEEAKTKLKEIIKEEYYDERSLETCELYEINKIVDINVGEIYAEMIEELNTYNEELMKERERMEYERLKRKYEE